MLKVWNKAERLKYAGLKIQRLVSGQIKSIIVRTVIRNVFKWDTRIDLGFEFPFHYECI